MRISDNKPVNPAIDFAASERRQIIRQTHSECVEHQQIRLQLQLELSKSDRMEHSIRVALRYLGKHDTSTAMEILTWGLIGP